MIRVNVLVVSVSHRTAPLSVLSALAMDAAGSAKLLDAVMQSELISEAFVLSTCNRTEVYVAASRFHGALDEVVTELASVGGLNPEEMGQNCSVFYDEAAVRHAFLVASGLDSVVAGEHQILGQVRRALNVAQNHGTIGSTLNALFQQALRVGKRVQTETAIGGAGRSLVGAAIEALDLEVSGRAVTIVGAGSMAAVAAHTVAERGASITVVNRTFAKAERLAELAGGRAVPMDELASALATSEVLISCTGALGVHLTVDDLAGTTVRDIVDLGLPADVSEDVESLDGVRLMNLDRLMAEHADSATSPDVDAAQALVAEEITDFLAARRAAAVAPTVVALRTMANEVLEREQLRLAKRVPDLTAEQQEEIAQSMRRVVEKLLHQPTVNLKRAAASPSDYDYARALRDLFALDPAVIDTVRKV